jgi:hypothetical protein
MRLGAAFSKLFFIAKDFDLDFTLPEEIITLANRCLKLSFGESPVPTTVVGDFLAVEPRLAPHHLPPSS